MEESELEMEDLWYLWDRLSEDEKVYLRLQQCKQNKKLSPLNWKIRIHQIDWTSKRDAN